MKKKQSKKILTLIGIVSLMLLIVMIASTMACAKPVPAPAPSPAPAPAPSPAPAESITLILTTGEAPLGVWANNIFKPWFAEIEKNTGGRVKIEAHWSAELVSFMESYDAAKKGTVDIAHFLPPMLGGKFPMDEIVTFSPYDTLCWKPSRVYWDLLQTFPEMRAPYNDTKLLTVGVMFVRGRLCPEKAIRKLEDHQGLKAKATGKWAGARLEALGATPVSLPPGDIYSQYQTGLIDFGDTLLFMLEDQNLGELLKYITVVNGSNPFLGFAMNLETWNSLPADLQKIMEDSGEWFVDFYDQVQMQVYNERMLSAKKKWPNIEWIELSKEELARWVAADKPVMDAFVAELEAKGLPGEKLRDEFLGLEKKYAAPEYAPSWAK